MGAGQAKPRSSAEEMAHGMARDMAQGMADGMGYGVKIEMPADARDNSVDDVPEGPASA